MARDPGVQGSERFFQQDELFEAGIRAACTVSSRASSSNDAGTVSTIGRRSSRSVWSGEG